MHYVEREEKLRKSLFIVLQLQSLKLFDGLYIRLIQLNTFNKYKTHKLRLSLHTTRYLYKAARAKCHNRVSLLPGFCCFYTQEKRNESTSVKASETTGAIHFTLGFITLAGGQKIQLPTRSLSDVNYPSTAVFTWTDTHAQ